MCDNFLTHYKRLKDSGQQIIVYKFKRNSPIPVIVH